MKTHARLSLILCSALVAPALAKEPEIRKEIREVNITARRARDEALTASQMAVKAQATAEEAKARAEATDARIDRMSK